MTVGREDPKNGRLVSLSTELETSWRLCYDMLRSDHRELRNS